MEFKDKAKQWLSDRYNLIFLGILAFALFIRVYFWYSTKGQTLWWDESEYGAIAKYFSIGLDYLLNNQRPFIFPWIISILFTIGFSEQIIKFLLVVLPSVFLVGAVYYLGKEMFNRKVALIASFLTAVNWSLIFWTARLQPDSISMLFQVLAVYFMWRYWKENKTKLIIFAGIFASLGFNFKVSGLLVPASFFIFILIKDRLSFIKNKDYWIFFLAFLVILAPQFVYSYISFGSATSFLTDSGYASVVLENKPIGWYVFKFFYSLTENILFIFFIAGLIISLSPFLYLDLLVKDKTKCFNPRLFSLITLVVVLLFYVFYVRGAEDRWVFLWLPFIFFMSSEALVWLYSLIKKHSHYIALALMAIILIFATYSHISHANELIKIKENSYSPVRDAGLWIRANSNPQDTVLSISIPQTAYYSERKTRSYSFIKIAPDFDELLKVTNARFLQVSSFEPHPQAINDWIAQNQARIRPVQVYYADQARTQPILIIYEVN